MISIAKFLLSANMNGTQKKDTSKSMKKALCIMECAKKHHSYQSTDNIYVAHGLEIHIYNVLHIVNIPCNTMSRHFTMKASVKQHNYFIVAKGF